MLPSGLIYFARHFYIPQETFLRCVGPMGQACCSQMFGKLRRSRRQYRHNKAYEFAPKRSWKYKDANLLSAEESEEGRNEGRVIGSDLAALVTLNTAPHPHHPELTQADGLEEGTDSGPSQIRRSGLLAFRDSPDSSSSNSDEEGLMTAPPSSTPLQTEDEVRVRTSSNASQQIGRFEVMMVTEAGEADVMLVTSQETSMLLPSHGSSDSIGQSRINSSTSDGQQIS